MGDGFGRRASDKDFVIWASERIGRLEEGYALASQGNQAVLIQIKNLDERCGKEFDELKEALYGKGPEKIGVFEKIRTLDAKVVAIILCISAVGGFIGRGLEKWIFK